MGEGGRREGHGAHARALLVFYRARAFFSPHSHPLPLPFFLVPRHSLGVLSTLTATGHPAGSAVQYAADDAGRLIMSLSSLSAHTRELGRDPRCALTVLSPWGFASLADARVTIEGAVAAPVPPEVVGAARAVYMAAHPDAFWADFGDFAWWRVDPAAACARAVLGFGRAGTVDGPAWAALTPDPVAAFSGPVCDHMNADHGDAVAAMVASAGVPGKIVQAAMKKVDALGFDAVAAVVDEGSEEGGKARPESVAVRVTFPRRAGGRKELKEVLVEMTRAVKGEAV